MRHPRAALAGLAALGLAAPAAGAAPKPSLQPLKLQPLEIRGTHFKSGESVLVVAFGGIGHATRRVTADALGTWTVVLPTRNAKERSFSVRATGNAGSAALWWPRAARPTGSLPVVPRTTP